MEVLTADRPLEQRIAQAGREVLGFGDAGLVLGAGPRLVVKFGYDGADGWPAWARWCQDQRSPHVPVVHAVHVVEHEGRPVAFVGIMERLQPTLFAARWLKADRSLKYDPFRFADLVEATHPSVAAMLRAAAAAFPNARWDATPSNWREREDGTVVLNDPISRADVREVLARAA